MRQVIISKGGDGFWISQCPSLPSCISQGKTKVDAIQNIRDAITEYILALKEDGIKVPTENFDALVLAV